MKQIRIHNDRPKFDNWAGFGGVYHGYMFQPDDAGRAYTPEQCEEELRRVGEMRLRIARTYFRYDYTWNGTAHDWQSVHIEAFAKWCAEMGKRGVDVAMQACWWCPMDLNGDRKGESPFRIGTNDWNEMVRRYAVWVSDAVRELVVRRGLSNIRYLVLFTEPGYTSGKLPEGKEQWECWLDCARAVNRQLTADGLRSLVKLVGPNEGSTATSPMIKWVAEREDGCVDIYSSHNYIQNLRFDFDTYDDWALWMKNGMDNCAQHRKPYWFDEYGLANWTAETEICAQRIRWTDGLYATHMALCNCAALNSGVQSTTIWSLLDQQWPDSHSDGRDSFVDGEHRCGIAPTLRQSHTPYAGYYGTCLLPRYLGGEGTLTYASEDDGHLRCAFVRTETGAEALLVINATGEPVSFRADFDRPHMTLHRRLADPAAIVPEPEAKRLPVDKSLDGDFTDVLPAWSFAVYSSERD